MALKINYSGTLALASSPKHLSIFECELIFISKPCSTRGWYNPHFTHRELKPEVIKVKSFHYFFVLLRTWFLSLFNSLLSVSKAQYVLPQLLLWELSTPSRQTQNLHPHRHSIRSTQSVITSDKVGFKNLPSTTQKFCGKEEDKQFPRAACDCLHHMLCLLLVQSLFSLQLQNKTASKVEVLDMWERFFYLCLISMILQDKYIRWRKQASFCITLTDFSVLWSQAEQ